MGLQIVASSLFISDQKNVSSRLSDEACAAYRFLMSLVVLNGVSRIPIVVDGGEEGVLIAKVHVVKENA